ncbi:FAD-dependent oxidoreductase [Clostridium estertheticum]|uniref:pyridine nucleotide-disulfide oxidoreductase/dicluster-binding protein n=1 Tax=Clostridium estertheticum TaxID=238834 RepID=UPI001C0B631B|nr:pyridine nucleotide-disulfide oxidoreductase/dicluster-binding protein [Clostridium estertheticum]MBU3199257.1 FAD-dependent oxidoreductase [Clostridium estertheticum]WAG67493.1 FAD-dependent oxidoreductase [Clostridium estertheticum]
MDLEKLLSMQKLCINDNPATCVTECPIHVDVKGFICEIRKENFEEAYRILNKRMPFINIIGLVCDHPCENLCVTNINGNAISIHELEKAVVIYGSMAKIKTLPMPKIDKKIAIIGGGISGITCAYDLNKKGYSVDIYEKENEIGGSLLKMPEIILNPELIKEEIIKLEEQGIEIKLNQEITPEKLKGLTLEYDAVFIGSGEWSEKFNVNDVTMQTETEKVFAGGRIVSGCESVIQSVQTGRCAAVSIDRFVYKKSLTALREKEGAYKSILKADIENEKISPRKKPLNVTFTKEEAINEALRCVQCECHKCVKACVHLQKVKLDPKAYIRTINQNERIILGDHYANKTINSCTECGLCGAVCPTSINMADIIKETRISMFSRNKMPLSAHDFALKDMEFANSKYFELIKHQPGKNNSKYVFYPGCQLSASYSEYVIKAYNYLMEKLDGGVGLYLGCCGAPAKWAGRQEQYDSSIEKVKSNLEKLGNPIVITACSTCFSNFGESLKNITIKSLWEIFDEKGLPLGAKSGNGKILAVHDACTTRNENGIQESIRNIAKRLHYEIEEPEFTKENTKCCGYGGLVYYTNKEFSREVTQDRIKDSDKDFLAYCAMCRDLFVLKGKKTYHILDLIYGSGKEEISDMKVPTLSERRANRFKLKKELLDNLWGEKMEIKDEYNDLKIVIGQELRNKIEDELILDGDIKSVIGYAEKTNDSFYNPENGHILAWKRFVNITFWVEYQKVNDSFNIINAYSHRMHVKGV